MRSAQHAFTLIEVLIALVILSIALSAIILTSAKASHDLHYVQQKNTAHQLALSLMNQSLISPQKPTTLRGQTIARRQHWTWQRHVESFNDFVKITVSIRQNDKLFSQLTGYRYDKKDEK